MDDFVFSSSFNLANMTCQLVELDSIQVGSPNVPSSLAHCTSWVDGAKLWIKSGKKMNNFRVNFCMCSIRKNSPKNGVASKFVANFCLCSIRKRSPPKKGAASKMANFCLCRIRKNRSFYKTYGKHKIV